MGFYIELSCDVSPEYSDCWVNNGQGPTIISRRVKDTREEITRMLSIIRKDAEAQGWKKVRGVGWVCPDCQRQQKEAQ